MQPQLTSYELRELEDLDTMGIGLGEIPEPEKIPEVPTLRDLVDKGLRRLSEITGLEYN